MFSLQVSVLSLMKGLREARNGGFAFLGTAKNAKVAKIFGFGFGFGFVLLVGRCEGFGVKVACFVAGVLFLLFAYWQVNDLGQYGTTLWPGWVMLYGFTALLSFWTVRRDAPRWVYAALTVGCVVNAVYRFTAIQWEGRILYNENNPAGNETGGLIIVALWAGFLWWKVPSMGRGALLAKGQTDDVDSV